MAIAYELKPASISAECHRLVSVVTLSMSNTPVLLAQGDHDIDPSTLAPWPFH